MSGAAVVFAAVDGFAAPSRGALSEGTLVPVAMAANCFGFGLWEDFVRGGVGIDRANFSNCSKTSVGFSRGADGRAGSGAEGTPSFSAEI